MLCKFNLIIGKSVQGLQIFIKAILKLLEDGECLLVFQQTFHLSKLACQKPSNLFAQPLQLSS